MIPKLINFFRRKRNFICEYHALTVTKYSLFQQINPNLLVPTNHVGTESDDLLGVLISVE